MKKFAILLAIVLLTMAINAQPDEEYYSYLILGKAVDENFKPAPFARIGVTPAPNSCCDPDYVGKADADGNIHFDVHDSSNDTKDRIFYITGQIPENAVAPITPPFSNSILKAEPTLEGRRIQINKNGEVYLGNVAVQKFYGTVEVFLRNKSNKLLFKKFEPWQDIFIRVSNAEDKVVRTVNLSDKEMKRGVDVSTSSVRIALPEGVWKLAISINEDKGPWLTNNLPIKIERDIKNLQVIFKKGNKFK